VPRSHRRSRLTRAPAEVTSVKPKRTGDRRSRFQLLPGGRFDVEGRGAKSASPAEGDVMVRSLLVARFQMTSARETRDLPVYHLIAARADGRTGPQLRP
jgi:hypothetical protein